MKLFILTKKHLLIGLGLCIVLCLVVIGVSKGLSVAVTAQKREIPIYSVATNEKKAALTFNVAWGDDDIDEIIAALKKHGVKATFFIV
ncbi:MAG: polysaccharide deacetylase family protein, partial [Clostridiales bacterium]|nr:polysaccharide deacetylase family protein [Clostridiales bacterium]